MHDLWPMFTLLRAPYLHPQGPPGGTGAAPTAEGLVWADLPYLQQDLQEAWLSLRRLGASRWSGSISCVRGVLDLSSSALWVSRGYVGGGGQGFWGVAHFVRVIEVRAFRVFFRTRKSFGYGCTLVD
jgi:hypothetical protein